MNINTFQIEKWYLRPNICLSQIWADSGYDPLLIDSQRNFWLCVPVSVQMWK